MRNARRRLCRCAATALFIVVALGVTTALAQDQKAAPADRPAANPQAAIRTMADKAMAKVAVPRLPEKKDIRLSLAKSALPGLPALPREIDLLSDIAVKLLSGNVTKLLADVCAELFSGNSTELFSGNEPELLSGNATELLSRNEPELLSGNATELLSRNEPELLSGNATRLFSGNELELFSNIKVEIKVTNSGNNNGNNGPPPPRLAPPAKVKKPAKPQEPAKPKKPAKRAALDQDQSGTVSFDEFSASKAQTKLRRAKSRFDALDANGDGLLSFEEFTSQRTDSPSVAQR
jgi:hypothetical protein